VTVTDQTAAPDLWQHLVQWQPATAAALALHVRALPEDWPARVFGVGRPDAALVLSPGATGEQFPDRAPEIAPFDESAPLDDCPACEEAAGTCRFHEGYVAGHHEQAQAQRDAVKARPDIGLREFMLWQADVEEAQDQGQEPPLLPAAPAGPAPATDPDTEIAQLREKYMAGLRRADEINNQLMEEVQRYADGKERPVLWSVYNQMHKRALDAEAEVERLRRLAGEAQQDPTQDGSEAHPPLHAWRVETRDPLANEWAPGSHFPRRQAAVERYETANRTAPLWRDGTPVERRIVRETTTYTVEEPTAVARPGQPETEIDRG
jgi:hypothetical protein